MAPILDGEVARRWAQATPDAEHCPLRADFGMGSKFLGGLRPPDVEFVDGRYVSWCQGLDILAHRLESGEDHVPKVR